MADDAIVVTISREQLLRRLAEIDAMLDIMQSNDEVTLMAEREEIAWLLNDR